MINRITSLLIISLSFSSTQRIFFINHLVEKNGVLVRPMTNEVVIGDIYRYFKKGNINLKKVFVGSITTEGKNGNWIRWWNNGIKKSEGLYLNSEKDGLWIEWTELGNKYSQLLYKNGSLIQLKNCLLENCD